MSTIKNPVGPQPPSVYWRRRLLLLAVLVAVVIVVVLIIVRPGSGGTKTPTANQSSGQSGSPSPSFSSGTGGNAAACNPSVIALAAMTDAASYAVGVQPQLSMTITNNGANACNLDVGTDAQVYTITSGSDQIWSSTDCQTGKTALAIDAITAAVAAVPDEIVAVDDTTALVGTVLKQDPAPGTIVASGTKVTLTIARAPLPTTQTTTVTTTVTAPPTTPTTPVGSTTSGRTKPVG